ncbi:MAG: hypothetical protein RLZZ514_1219 [Actinomycetota bacterium]|jgi:hypothetical protein
MEVKIGIRNGSRELVIDSNQSASEITDAVAKVLNENAKFLTFTDSKGKLFVVPTDALAYVEIGAEEVRRVGFIA